jgi:hypothetical protein
VYGGHHHSSLPTSAAILPIDTRYKLHLGGCASHTGFLQGLQMNFCYVIACNTISYSEVQPFDPRQFIHAISFGQRWPLVGRSGHENQPIRSKSEDQNKAAMQFYIRTSHFLRNQPAFLVSSVKPERVYLFGPVLGDIYNKYTTAVIHPLANRIATNKIRHT